MSIHSWTRSSRANRWFAGALAGALAITALDAATDLALIVLLAVPPLFAAMRTGSRPTAALGALCFALALALGFANSTMASRDHLIDAVTVGAVAVLAFYIARLRGRLEVEEGRSTLMATAGAALQRSLNPDASLQELARLAVPRVSDWCLVHVRQADGSLLQIAEAHRDPEKQALAQELGRRYPLQPDAERGVAAVVRSGSPEIYPQVPDDLVASIAHDDEHRRKLRSLGTRSALILPLTARGRTLGAITFTMAESGRRFCPEERELAQALADRAAVALDNSQLYAHASGVEAELRQSRDQLVAILDGVADGVTAQDATGKMVYANEAALALLGFPSVEAVQAVPIRYVLSRFEVFDEAGDPFPLERLPGRQALRGQKAADALVRFRRRDTGDERWSIIKATPICDPDGRVVLAINVFEDVTEHMARERDQRLLGRVGELLATSMIYENTLVRVAELCVPDVADLIAIDLVEGRQIRRVAVAAIDDVGLGEVLQMRRRFPFDADAKTGVASVIRTGAAELYPELDPDAFAAGSPDGHGADLIGRLGLRSAIFVPMTARGRTLGAISLCAGPSGRSFDETDLYLAEELAARCAIAIDNARLFRERTRIARTLQESLLPPSLPPLAGVDVAARFHAAGHGHEVGGDFYDVFEIGGGSFGVTVGDVCGKGPDAAAVTALARYTLRATAMREPSPAEVLRMLNKAMIQDRGERRFCTVAYARFDPTESGMRVTVASGGHPLPLALRAGAPPADCGVPGTLLGVLPDPEIADVAVSLEPGDVMVLYTDGVTEASAPKRVWTSGDLARFAGLHEPLRAAAIAERIERGALAARAGEPRDDVAIVVLKVLAPGARPSDRTLSDGLRAL